MDTESVRIAETECSKVFFEGMRNRMVVSFYKYGHVGDAYPDKVDAIGSMMDRLRKYASDGNTEWLMDAANFAMIEFMFPRHPEAHFEGTDADASPGRRSLRTGKADDRDNRDIGTNPHSITARFR